MEKPNKKEVNALEKSLIEVREERQKQFEEFQKKLFELQDEYNFSIETQYTIRHDGIHTGTYLVDRLNILKM